MLHEKHALKVIFLNPLIMVLPAFPARFVHLLQVGHLSGDLTALAKVADEGTQIPSDQKDQSWASYSGVKSR